MNSAVTPTLTEPASRQKSALPKKKKEEKKKLAAAQRRCSYLLGVSNSSNALTKQSQNNPLRGKLDVSQPVQHRFLGVHSEISSCNLIPRIIRLGNSFPKEVTGAQSLKIFTTRLAERHMEGTSRHDAGWMDSVHEFLPAPRRSASCRPLKVHAGAA